MKEKSMDFRTVRGYQLLDKSKNLLTDAMEDYLEMMYRETLQDQHIRIGTLARLLHVNPSSATKMVQRLGRLNMVIYQKYGIVKLSERGLELGQYLYHRHQVLQQFLQFLSPGRDCLHETERMEHSIHGETLHAIRMFNAFVEANPHILEQFRAFRHDQAKS